MKTLKLTFAFLLLSLTGFSQTLLKPSQIDGGSTLNQIMVTRPPAFTTTRTAVPTFTTISSLGIIQGSLTSGYIPYAVSSTSVANSNISDDGTTVTVNGNFYAATSGGAEIYTSGTSAYMSADQQSNTNIETNLSQNHFFHNVKNTFDAPANNFPNSTASTIAYFDASKNIVSSTVTPTELNLLGGVNGTLATTAMIPTVTANYIAYGSATNTLTGKGTIRVDPTNNCIILGTGSGVAGLNEPSSQTQKPQFEIVNNALDNAEQVQQFNMKTYGSNPGTSSDMHFYRMDGTEAAPTNTKLNMFLMSTGYRGYGTTMPTESSVAFQVKASENWTDNAQGANIIFQTTANGTPVLTGRRSALMINNDQRIFLSKAHATYAPYRSTAILNIDLTNATSPSSTLNIGALMTHSTSQSASIIMGSSATDEAYIYHYGSVVAGNYPGSSLPILSTMNFQSGSASNQSLRIAGSNVCAMSGTVTTNASTRLDAVGFRVGTVANVHTTNVNTFSVGGSVAYAYIAKTSAYTATINDYTIDCTSGTFAITLPTSVGITGRIYVINNSGSGTITLNTTSSQTIDGNASGVLTMAQNKAYTVQSNGANWIIIAVK